MPAPAAGVRWVHCMPMSIARLLLPATLLWCALVTGVLAGPSSVYLEELTSAEVAGALREGHTTLIIPVGGTEQNGPHMALGKHNVRARILSGRIAQQLGNALVAPVLSYVPEGSVSPPTEHMRFAGTISVPEGAFKSILEAAARSFRQHGFRDIVLLGDSGNYQPALREVVQRLNRDWAKSGTRAIFAERYYRATQTTYIGLLKGRGLSEAQIGTHAAVADTSLLMALEPALVRPGLFDAAAREGKTGGTGGDPRGSSAELGQLGVQAIVQQSVAEIRAAVSAPR